MGTEKKHKNSWRKKKWAEEQRQREGEREIELKGETREGKGGRVGERCAERSARVPSAAGTRPPCDAVCSSM